jgi:hypothetical protein
MKSGGYVAMVLAVSLGLAFNVFCFAVLWTAIESDAPLSENATQVLTGWGGGIIGILGAYIGYRIGVQTVPPGPEGGEALPSDRDTTISG